MRHVIDAVPFKHDQPSADALLTCSCSWQGPVSEYQEHRKAAAADNTTSLGRHNGSALGPATASSWVRRRKPLPGSMT